MNVEYKEYFLSASPFFLLSLMYDDECLMKKYLLSELSLVFISLLLSLMNDESK